MAFFLFTDDTNFVKMVSGPVIESYPKGFFKTKSDNNVFKIEFGGKIEVKVDYNNGDKGKVDGVLYNNAVTLKQAIDAISSVTVSINEPNEPDGSLPVTIKSPLEANGGIPVNVQDQHTQIIELLFAKVQNATTNNLDTVVDQYTISLTDSTGFIDGTYVGIFAATGEFYFATQVGAPAAGVITLDTPLDNIYLSGSNVLGTTNELAVNGAVTRQVFQIGPIGLNIEVDITRIMGYIQDGTAMDDSLFGGIAALTNGVVLRKNNGVMQNIWNVKTNGDIGLICFDANETNRAPAGSYGFRFRNTFAGQSKHGVTIRLEASDILEILIQDDLTDLESFKIMAQGHFVTD